MPANPLNIEQAGNRVRLQRKVSYSAARAAQERLANRLDAADQWSSMSDSEKINFLGPAVRDLIIINTVLADEVRELRKLR